MAVVYIIHQAFCIEWPCGPAIVYSYIRQDVRRFVVIPDSRDECYSASREDGNDFHDRMLYCLVMCIQILNFDAVPVVEGGAL